MADSRRQTLEPNETADSTRHRLPVEEYVSVRRAAAILSVSEKTIRGLIQRGGLASFRIGRLIRIKRRDLIACVEREVPSNEAADARTAEDIADGILNCESRHRND